MKSAVLISIFIFFASGTGGSHVQGDQKQYAAGDPESAVEFGDGLEYHIQDSLLCELERKDAIINILKTTP